MDTTGINYDCKKIYGIGPISMLNVANNLRSQIKIVKWYPLKNFVGKFLFISVSYAILVHRWIYYTSMKRSSLQKGWVNLLPNFLVRTESWEHILNTWFSSQLTNGPIKLECLPLASLTSHALFNTNLLGLFMSYEENEWLWIPTDKLQLIGQHLGRVFDFSSCMWVMHLCRYEAKWLNVKLKTRPKQLLH